MNSTVSAPTFGPLLRDWRRRRSLSQLALAADAEVSQRHLSFIESGRSTPSRDIILRLAERLALPLRERNQLLVAAGYAPVFQARGQDDPAMAAANKAVALILERHAPFPALAIDRHWTLVHANAAVFGLLDGVDPGLLTPPVNVLRLSLHPDGLGGRIVNFREWRDHVLHRLAEQVSLTADPVLTALLEELRTYPTPPGAAPHRRGSAPALAGVAVPFRLRTAGGILSFLSTTTVFGTALDITLSELAIEAFFPADDETAAALMDGRDSGRR
ncbi:helix-turn-helix transcriptional regulator [Thalassobaculum sp. OXR-137]|uniref:helix-turn-helix domain-containing protein n=1 Tax=Thalassobaculum sp. OXR-137 TaxID=3100173 RepID=UPI002AC8ACBF|nr:helix-turn-helix transcriptional regulator [Thalassobaculum sp. OXR-137]WPZ35293.1 helix-turn-helix transcriptional regulator [Thalassobaculum sp. OXR-137]